ncbi:MAG: hypothetical protein ACOX65_11150 [Anaerotruncus rubiinfantis]|jgi:hypothetical protein
MTAAKVVDLKTVIGVYPLCNTGAVLVHAIDYAEDKILASINGENPEWCDMTEEYMEVTGDTELGFTLGSFFIPLFEVMRFYRSCVCAGAASLRRRLGCFASCNGAGGNEYLYG